MTSKFSKPVLCLVLLFAIASAAAAADTSFLKPPAGAPVAIVVFEDLECPACATATPVLVDVSKQMNVPLVIYDYPLPMHPWAQPAAVLAKYFTSKSPELGLQFREFMYKNQNSITPENVNQFAQRFASEHHVELPFAVDPQGKFAEAISQDKNLGNRAGLQHTPTMFVVTNKTQQDVEYTGNVANDRNQFVNAINQARQQLGASAAAEKPAVKPAAAKTATKRPVRKSSAR